MRISLLKQWALVSTPLLLVLAGLWVAFDGEQEVAAYFLEHSTSHQTWRAVFKFITDWSNPVFYVFYAWMLISAFRRRDPERKRYMAILLGVQVVVAVLSVHFIKHTIGRPRPGQGWYFDPLTTRGNYHSLPSGHTTEFVGWAMPLALRKNTAWLSGLIGLAVGLVGFSRIYLGWHHPSDVFFGWLLGGFGGITTHILAESNLFRRKIQE